VEAGFTIYAIIVRILRDAWMVAPGLVPQRGDRVRSDRIRQSFSSRALSGRRRSGFFKFNVLQDLSRTPNCRSCGGCFCVARPPPNIGEHRKGSMLAWEMVGLVI
jgi:hypothetical protein